MSTNIAKRTVLIIIFLITLVQISVAVLERFQHTLTRPASASPLQATASDAEYNAFYPAELSTEIILPFVNSKATWEWLTTTIIQNASDSTASLTFRYYNTAGKEDIVIKDTLPAMANRSYTSPPNFSGSLVVLSNQLIGAIVTETPIDANREGDGLMSYKGISASDSYTEVGLLPIYREYTGWNSFFAVQNAGGSTAAIDISFINAAGDFVHSLSDSLPGHAAHWYNTADMAQLGTGFFGRVHVRSDLPVTGVTNAVNRLTGEAVAHNNRNLLTAPFSLNMLPHLTNESIILLYNASETAGKFLISFYSQNSSAIETIADSLGGGVTKLISLDTIEQLPSGFIGSAVIVSEVPFVSVVENRLLDSAATRTSYSGIPAEHVTMSATVPVVRKITDGPLTRIIVQNADAQNAGVTVKYYDEKGSLTWEETAVIPSQAAHHFDQAESSLPAEFSGSARVTSDRKIAVVGLISEHIFFEPVVADFIANPLRGRVPLIVNFTNLSTGEYDTCEWDFGDGAKMISCGNPSHNYVTPDDYTVKLKISGLGGTDTKLRENYIEVEPVRVYLPSVANSGLRSASTEIAFVSDISGDRDIYLINESDTDLKNLTKHWANDFDPLWSPGGDMIAFGSDRSGTDDIYIMRADGTGVRRLTFLPTDSRGPKWSQDGSKIAFASEDRGVFGLEIYWMNSDGSGLTRVYRGPLYGRSVSWDPDGKRLLFDANVGNFDIFSVNLDGSGLKALAQTYDWEFTPILSPDGRHLAFASDRLEGSSDIFIAAPGGDNATSFTGPINYSFGPVWSPDSYWLAFMSYLEGLYVMRPDGSEIKKLTNKYHLGSQAEWSWSPYGDKIVFAASSDGNPSMAEIYVVGIDASGLKRLTWNSADDGFPVWLP